MREGSIQVVWRARSIRFRRVTCFTEHADDYPQPAGR